MCDDVVYAAAAAGKKHGVSLRLPQRRSPRSSTDLGKTPSSRGKIIFFGKYSVNLLHSVISNERRPCSLGWFAIRRATPWHPRRVTSGVSRCHKWLA